MVGTVDSVHEPSINFRSSDVAQDRPRGDTEDFFQFWHEGTLYLLALIFAMAEYENRIISPYSWKRVASKLMWRPFFDPLVNSTRLRATGALAGIPPEVFHYRLGNRSALEWVIDQYQVSTDKRSGPSLNDTSE